MDHHIGVSTLNLFPTVDPFTINILCLRDSVAFVRLVATTLTRIRRELYEIRGENEFMDVDNRPPMQDPEFGQLLAEQTIQIRTTSQTKLNLGIPATQNHQSPNTIGLYEEQSQKSKVKYMWLRVRS